MVLCDVTQRNAVEYHDNGGGCSPEIPWYGVGCLPSGAVHVTQHDVINLDARRDDVTERYLRPMPPYYNAGVPSHYVF